MAKSYRLTGGRRFFNGLMTAMLRLGLAPKTMYLLTVPGRRSGLLRSTPVSPVLEGGPRWLVAPYGEVAWVGNARAACKVTLSRGRWSETFKIAELNDEDAAPILKRYVTSQPIIRAHFDAIHDDPLEQFVAEASRHPVFKLLDATGG
jgi:deazaflavin-dependent oxidoreductase (nitroreductase family)